MKNDPPCAYSDNEALLLTYLEGRLSPREQAELERHLTGCPRCSTELRELSEIVGALRDNREAFCPEPWQVYELIHYGTDPEGRIAGHLDQCLSCRALAEQLKSEAAPRMPAAVARELLDRTRPERSGGALAESRWQSVGIRFFTKFRIPALAAGLAAAVIVAAVLMLPSSMPEYAVVLGTGSWETVPRPKEGMARPRVAMVIVFKGFDKQPSQSHIDELYNAAAPTMSVYERYHIIPPDAFRDRWKKDPLSSPDRQSLVRWLHEKLNASRAAIVTISPDGKEVSLEVDLLDTTTETVLQHEVARNVPQDLIKETVRRLVLSALLD